MGSTRINCVQSAVASAVYADQNFRSRTTFPGGFEDSYLLLSFGDIPEAAKYKKFQSIDPQLYVSSGTGIFRGTLSFDVLLAPFNEANVTYNNMPAVADGGSKNYDQDHMPQYLNVPDTRFSDVDLIIQNGIRVDRPTGSTSGTISTGRAASSVRPYIEYIYDDEPITVDISPSPSRTLFREAPSVFTWSITPTSLDSILPNKQKSAKFKWRVDSSAQVHEISIAGDVHSATIPAGTFSTDTVEVQIEVTSSSDGVSSTEWMEFTVKGAILADESPKAGFVNEKAANRFSWNIKQDGSESTPIAQTSATFKYKNGTDGAVQSISLTTDKYVVIPANTFTANAVLWQVSVTTQYGTTLTSPWYTLTTVEQTSSAVGISPANIAVNGEQPTTFTWSHIISTGTAQTKFDLQVSNDQEDWQTIKTASQPETLTTIPAYELPSGTVYWRVRTYNTDNLAGSWSVPLQIVVLAPPPVLSITVVSAEPKWSIRWSQSDQNGYEIEFDGRIIKSDFGLDNSYTYNGYAEDGDHTVRVRVQNAYSVWSEWASAAIQIENEPGEPIQLSATLADGVPEVTLVVAGGDADSYIYYRNGEEIGRSESSTFVDRFVIGESVYKALGIYADSGNYSASSDVRADARITVPWLYSTKTKQWLPLRMSEKQTNGLSQSYSVAAAFLHFAGTMKPSVEYGVSSDRSISFSVGFVNGSEELQKFLAMFGGTVCAKFPDGDMIIGAMFNWDRTHGRHYTEFSTKIIETEFDEVAANG